MKHLFNNCILHNYLIQRPSCIARAVSLEEAVRQREGGGTSVITTEYRVLRLKRQLTGSEFRITTKSSFLFNCAYNVDWNFLSMVLNARLETQPLNALAKSYLLANPPEQKEWE
jgi:hypothetical protein